MDRVLSHANPVYTKVSQADSCPYSFPTKIYLFFLYVLIVSYVSSSVIFITLIVCVEEYSYDIFFILLLFPVSEVQIFFPARSSLVL
jgi:hypothetical protein